MVASKFKWLFQTTHPEKTLNNAQLINAINEKNHGKLKWRRAGSRLGGSQHPQPSRAQSRTISTVVMSPPANKILFDLKNNTSASSTLDSSSFLVFLLFFAINIGCGICPVTETVRSRPFQRPCQRKGQLAFVGGICCSSKSSQTASVCLVEDFIDSLIHQTKLNIFFEFLVHFLVLLVLINVENKVFLRLCCSRRIFSKNSR